MKSDIFILADATAAAFSRHGDAVATAPTAARKHARELALEHLTDIFLARELEASRIAENARLDAEHRQRLEQERIAKIRRAFAECDVDKLAGKVAFFTEVLGGAVTACDAGGNVGNRAAEMNTKAALSMLANAGSENQWHVQLPAGVVCVRVHDVDAWRKLVATWKVPSTVSWRFRDCDFYLFAGSIGRNIDCGEFAFTANARCGRDADFTLTPAEVKLDEAARLPTLPKDVADAVAQTAAGSEKLLKAFLLH